MAGRAHFCFGTESQQCGGHQCRAGHAELNAANDSTVKGYALYCTVVHPFPRTAWT